MAIFTIDCRIVLALMLVTFGQPGVWAQSPITSLSNLNGTVATLEVVQEHFGSKGRNPAQTKEVTCARNNGLWAMRSIMPITYENDEPAKLFGIAVNRKGIDFLTAGWVEKRDGKCLELVVVLTSPSLSSTSETSEYLRRILPIGNEVTALFILGEVGGIDLLGELKDAVADSPPGAETILFKTSTDNGDSTFFCNEADSFFPHRIEIVQSGRHLYRGKRIDEIDMKGGNLWPAGGVEKIITTIDEVTISETDGHRYPSSWRCESTSHCKSGDLVTTQETVKVRNIAFNADFDIDDILFGSYIPNGTQVTVSDANQLAFVWNDGWPIPKAEAIRAWTRPAGLNYFRIAFWTVVVLTLCAGIVLWRSRNIVQPQKLGKR